MGFAKYIEKEEDVQNNQECANTQKHFQIQQMQFNLLKLPGVVH